MKNQVLFSIKATAYSLPSKIYVKVLTYKTKLATNPSVQLAEKLPIIKYLSILPSSSLGYREFLYFPLRSNRCFPGCYLTEA